MQIFSEVAALALHHQLHLIKHLPLELQQCWTQFLLLNDLYEVSNQLKVTVFVLLVLPHQFNYNFPDLSNTNITFLPLALIPPTNNIIMHFTSEQPQPTSPPDHPTPNSIRLIRQKLEASRGRGKGALAPIALHQPLLQAFELQVQEQQEICDRAVQRLREGSSIVIDWTTRSNFRVKTEIPQVKTEPINLSKSRSPSIETKRIELAKLLHERNKKFYMKSKAEQAEEA